VCSLLGVTNTTSTTCTVDSTPDISITETCPPGPVLVGDILTFTGVVSNTGDITLTNVLVFSSHTNTPILGPIILTPGASAPFSGHYVALGGADAATNTTILTNIVSTVVTNTSVIVSTNTFVVIKTNAATATQFGTIDPVSHAVTDRFVIGTNFTGLTYAGEDHGYGATEFYAMRQDSSGISHFDTINAKTSTVTDRFTATDRDFDALTYAAGDLGYGPLLFYYLSHDNAGVSTFGSITPGGVVGVTSDHFVVGNNFDALTFTATDVGYGANLFYYVRHDSTGLSTFGTINPALPGTITDRFTVGTNVDALVFTDLIAPGYGPNNFYYLRHDNQGISSFGTIFVTGPTTAAVNDRFVVATNATELTFTATDAGSFGPNLFYFLHDNGPTLVTNILVTFSTNTLVTLHTNTVFAFTTNSIVSFNPTNTVTAFGTDICQAQTVTAAANCAGPLFRPGATPVSVLAGPSDVNGLCSLSFPTQKGITQIVQYKNMLSDPEWTDLETVKGTGTNHVLTDTTASEHQTRFYRVMSVQ